MSEFIVLGFYKYVRVENLEPLAEELQEFCNANDMKGSILLGEEGVNASVSGTREAVDKFKEKICSIVGFGDLYFKEERTSDHPFKKMKVKLRKEIVAFGRDVDLSMTGKHISPDEFLDLYEDGKLKENIILIDARNEYEYRIGKFKDAIHFDIEVFRDFMKESKRVNEMKDKKIVMYCTGGVRCEKASAYLKENGFGDVSQLNQGIVNFCSEKESDVWEGKCFVFDKRMVSDFNSDGKPIGECYTCGKECDFLRNCKNVDCNLFYVSCIECEKEFSKCCSKECREIYVSKREGAALLKA